MKKANKTIKRSWPVRWHGTACLLRRNYHQIKYTKSVYVISTFKDGMIDGGSIWASQMFLDARNGAASPLYVFDQKTGLWSKWEGFWATIEMPPRPEDVWTGIGTRDINDRGEEAIERLFEYV